MVKTNAVASSPITGDECVLSEALAFIEPLGTIRRAGFPFSAIPIHFPLLTIQLLLESPKRATLETTLGAIKRCLVLSI